MAVHLAMHYRSPHLCTYLGIVTVALLQPLAASLHLSRNDAGPAARFDEGAYVTYVSGKAYVNYALVLTASLHDLNHKRPHVYLVKPNTTEAAVASELEAAAAKFGWNLRIETYDPISIPWKTAFEFWDEAWQRVTLYDMKDRFGRVMHLDSDVLLFDSVEGILEKAPIPTVARRMGGCETSKNLCQKRPVTNVMVVEPNATIADDIREWVKNYHQKHHKAGQLGPDETGQLSFFNQMNYFGPEDAIYFDCFTHHDDMELQKVGLSVKRMPRAVHLGIPFKGIVQEHNFSSFKEASLFVDELEASNKTFQAAVARRWYELYFSPAVQGLLQVYASSEKTKARMFHEVSDICD